MEEKSWKWEHDRHEAGPWNDSKTDEKAEARNELLSTGKRSGCRSRRKKTQEAILTSRCWRAVRHWSSAHAASGTPAKDTFRERSISATHTGKSMYLSNSPCKTADSRCYSCKDKTKVVIRSTRKRSVTKTGRKWRDWHPSIRGWQRLLAPSMLRRKEER